VDTTNAKGGQKEIMKDFESGKGDGRRETEGWTDIINL
jgi:hypothetical protein